MIQSKILGDAVGIEYAGVNDQSEREVANPLTTAVVIGKFKRGVVGKPFLVSRDNYRQMLGYDPNNPCYMVVEDVFRSNVPSLHILRTGSSVPKPKSVASSATQPVDTQPVATQPTVNPAPPVEKQYEILINGNNVKTFSLDELRQGFSVGGFSFVYDGVNVNITRG